MLNLCNLRNGFISWNLATPVSHRQFQLTLILKIASRAHKLYKWRGCVCPGDFAESNAHNDRYKKKICWKMRHFAQCIVVFLWANNIKSVCMSTARQSKITNGFCKFLNARKNRLLHRLLWLGLIMWII